MIKKITKNYTSGQYTYGKRALCFDTNPRRDGLHIFMIDRNLEKEQDGSSVIRNANIHLDRKQCLALIKDIEERLF